MSDSPGPPPPPPPIVHADVLTGNHVIFGGLDGRTETSAGLRGGMTAEQVREVLDAWAERTEALGARHDVGYVLIVQDGDGPSEIHAYAALPPAPARELAVHPCPLCYELAGDRLVAEATGWRAWVPAAAISPNAVTIAPIGHRSGLPALTAWERDGLATLLADVLGRLDGPRQLWVHQRPTDGGEWPNCHVHVEIVAVAAGAAQLASGVYVNPVPPPEAAARLRER